MSSLMSQKTVSGLLTDGTILGAFRDTLPHFQALHMAQIKFSISFLDQLTYTYKYVYLFLLTVGPKLSSFLLSGSESEAPSLQCS